jgi:hypothetical protein
MPVKKKRAEERKNNMNRRTTTIITIPSVDVPVLSPIFGSRFDGRKGPIGIPTGSVLSAAGALIIVVEPMASLPNWIVTAPTPEGRVRVCVRNIVIVVPRVRCANDRT